jgi:hypothetical protein
MIMTRSIAVAMAAAIAVTPLASTELRPRGLRSEIAYKFLTWQEKSDICIAGAPLLLEECGEPESVLAVAETTEQVELEDGTVVVETSHSFVGMAAPDQIEEKTSSVLREQITYGLGAAIGWQAGWIVGTAAGNAVLSATAGTSLWAVGLGTAVLAPWIGGAVLAAGGIY